MQKKKKTGPQCKLRTLVKKLQVTDRKSPNSIRSNSDSEQCEQHCSESKQNYFKT